MEYLVIGMNLQSSQGCKCYGSATYLPEGCGNVCDVRCSFVCGNYCAARYCDGSVRAMPYMQGNTI